MLRLLLVCASLFLFALPARPMGWYEPSCCSNKDCRPVFTGEVEVRPEGWYVKRFDTILAFDNWRVKRSQDHQMHLCATETTLRCLYVPDPGI